MTETDMTEADLLEHISVNPKTFGGKPITRGWRQAVEYILDTPRHRRYAVDDS